MRAIPRSLDSCVLVLAGIAFAAALATPEFAPSASRVRLLAAGSWLANAPTPRSDPDATLSCGDPQLERWIVDAIPRFIADWYVDHLAAWPAGRSRALRSHATGPPHDRLPPGGGGENGRHPPVQTRKFPRRGELSVRLERAADPPRRIPERPSPSPLACALARDGEVRGAFEKFVSKR